MVFLDHAPVGVRGDQCREHIKTNGVVTSLDEAVEHRVPVLEFTGRIMAQQPGEIPHGNGGWPLVPADTRSHLWRSCQAIQGRSGTESKERGAGCLFQELASVGHEHVVGRWEGTLWRIRSVS